MPLAVELDMLALRHDARFSMVLSAVKRFPGFVEYWIGRSGHKLTSSCTKAKNRLSPLCGLRINSVAPSYR